jgi:hypothetical protein
MNNRGGVRFDRRLNRRISCGGSDRVGGPPAARYPSDGSNTAGAPVGKSNVFSNPPLSDTAFGAFLQ